MYTSIFCNLEINCIIKNPYKQIYKKAKKQKKQKKIKRNTLKSVAEKMQKKKKKKNLLIVAKTRTRNATSEIIQREDPISKNLQQ